MFAVGFVIGFIVGLLVIVAFIFGIAYGDDLAQKKKNKPMTNYSYVPTYCSTYSPKHAQTDEEVTDDGDSELD